MAKRLIAPFLVGLLVGALIVSLVHCPDSAALAKAKADYAQFKAIAAAADALKQAALLKAEETITQKDAEIAERDKSIVAKNAQVAALTATLHDLQAAEPPTTPEIESLPIVINLRAQVKALARAFDLSQNVVIEQGLQIKAWEAKFNAQVTISETWRTRYENERTLRVACEGMFKAAEHQVKANKFWRTAAIVAGAVAVGAILKK
jgi:hypothetical protein